MDVIFCLLLDLIRLPFRGAGWVLLRIAGEPKNDLAKLNGVVTLLNNDRSVTKSRKKRNYSYD